MIGQPRNYSEMLKTIFWASLIVGIACTLFLGYKSPEIGKLLNSSSNEWNLGPIALPLVQVAIPFFIAILARMITLHDKISDLFKIRENFDFRYILMNLAKGVNFAVDHEMQNRILNNRNDLMLKTFFKYAPNVDDAVINSQLVATALDRWTWFWCLIEPTIIIIVSGILAWIYVDYEFAFLFFLCSFIFIFIAIYNIYPTCKSAAINEVNDILTDETRKTEIRKVFNALQNK